MSFFCKNVVQSYLKTNVLIVTVRIIQGKMEKEN